MPPNSLKLIQAAAKYAPRPVPREEPKVMTWGQAIIVIAIAIVFDALRAFLHFFWFFGPAILAAYCAYKVGDIAIIGGLAAKACVVAAGAAGVAGIEVTGPLGEVAADAVGLMCFLALGLFILLTNARLIKTATSAPMQFAAAFAVGEIPFLGALPVFTVVIWKLYRTQIRTEKQAHQTWEKANAAELAQKRQQQALQAAQIANAQQEEALEAAGEEEAATEAQLEEDEMANDSQYNEIPARVPRIA
jgi:hypothetical protein